MINAVCRCDEVAPHVVARRLTTDGIGVEVWQDGAITGRLGFGLEGVPVVRPRSRGSVSLAQRAGWLFAGEVEAHAYVDLGALYAACRWAAERDGLPGTVRARLAQLQQPALAPVWTVTDTDRDGTPTERVWRLPRLRWPGVVVFDHVNQGRRGRYEICTLTPGVADTVTTTGLHFSTQAQLIACLLDWSCE